jgi:integrase
MFARMVERADTKVSEIQARLGHKSLATTDRYLADLRRAENPYADELVWTFGFAKLSL